MKKILAIAMVIVMLIALPTGCGDKKMSSTYLIWNIGVESKTFDPGLNNANDGGHIIQNLFEGLMQETEKGLKTAQAKSYKISEDGLVYTFKLRDDIKWSDGKSVTAQDFVYSWQRICDPTTASEYSFLMAPYIVGGEDFLNGKGTADAMGVKAKDDKTLEVTLNFPCSYFLSLTTFYTYMPVRKDAVESGEGWERNPATCFSNGPFTLEEYVIGSHLKMKKSETYYGAKNVRLAGVKGLMIVEETTAHNAYLSGEININEKIPQDEIPKLRAEDPNFTAKAQVGTYYAMFNMDNPAVSDVRVRKALSLAIDRKQIVENVTKGGQIPATGFIPPNLTYSDGKLCRDLDEKGNPKPEFGIDPNKASIEEARKLLAEAGYPDGKGFPKLTYIYNTQEGHQRIAEAMQEMWKNNLGIEVELKNEEWAIFQDTRRLGNYSVARGGWLGDYAAPMTMLDLYTSYSGNNDTQWRWNDQPSVAPHDKTLNPGNKGFDDAIKEAMMSSGKKQDEAYRKAEQIMMDEQILMPIYYYSFIYMIDSSKVIGIEKTQMGQWIFKNAEMLN
jgi:oligopeptide transport system substrate-binding protein